MSSAPESVPITLETDRLVLRTPVVSDAQALCDYYVRNDERFARWRESRWQHAEDYVRWIAACAASGHELTFMAFAGGGREIVAVVTLNGFSREEPPQAMLAYSVDGAHEGRGYASEAVRRVVQYARDERGLKALTAYYDPGNDRSARLLQRLGFGVVGQTPVIPGFEKLMRLQIVAALQLA